MNPFVVFSQFCILTFEVLAPGELELVRKVQWAVGNSQETQL